MVILLGSSLQCFIPLYENGLSFLHDIKQRALNKIKTDSIDHTIMFAIMHVTSLCTTNSKKLIRMHLNGFDADNRVIIKSLLGLQHRASPIFLSALWIEVGCLKRQQGYIYYS